MSLAVALAERGLVPECLLRRAIRRRHAATLRAHRPQSHSNRDRSRSLLLDRMRSSPVALSPHLANEQHYELPSDFFALMLGPRMKYSCCLWPDETSELRMLPRAEEDMLRLTCERAGLQDGMRILELGCGWGSLTLWMAREFPLSPILAVTNSRVQAAFLSRRAALENLGNVRVLRQDMNDLSPEEPFDAVVSVEMIEHMRNWEELLRRVASWLVPGGRAFFHHFCHRDHPYFFGGAEGEWMSRHFFSGGMMPSENMLDLVHENLEPAAFWRISGMHYARTLEAWLANLRANRNAALAVLEDFHGRDARVRFRRWELFLLACSELFGFANGGEWFVTHALLTAPKGTRA